MKEEPLKVKPKIVLNCAVITVTAAAEQKPEITGPEMKSIRKPKEIKLYFREQIMDSIKTILISKQVKATNL